MDRQMDGREYSIPANKHSLQVGVGITIIKPNKNFQTLETFIFQIKFVSLKVKILSKGTLSRKIS